MKIAAIIPAFNEEKSIRSVVEEINTVARNSNLIIVAVVVNDCSVDRTAAIIEDLDCVPLHLPVNLGIGGAVQTGFKYAIENGFDRAVQVDGDGQHPAEFIPSLSKVMTENNFDVVIGSRYLDKKGFQSTRIRRTGIRYFKWLNKLFTGREIHDSTSGFRMLNRKALAVVNDYYPDEYPEPEAIVLFSKNKLIMGEVAVEMRERQGGVSSINSFAAVYYVCKVSLAIFFTWLRQTNNKQ
jgi:glycosyltransferase involved in cell wall biosynthesis